ncbi:unnamed protein product [Umbelopsis ramanniana]
MSHHDNTVLISFIPTSLELNVRTSFGPSCTYFEMKLEQSKGLNIFAKLNDVDMYEELKNWTFAERITLKGTMSMRKVSSAIRMVVKEAFLGDDWPDYLA